MDLQNSTVKSNHCKIAFSNFQGTDDQEIIKAFKEIGQKYNDLNPIVEIYTEANGQSKHRGVVLFKYPKTCKHVIQEPPIFNNVALTVSYEQANGSILEISDKSNFTNLYLVGTLENSEKSVLFDTQVLKDKLKIIDSYDIVFLNHPFLGTFNNQYMAILKFKEHLHAKKALTMINDIKTDIQVTKCCPSMSWA